MTSPTVVRTRPRWDVALSIVFMALAVIGSFFGLFLQLFFVAFTDSCLPKTCNIGLGTTEVFAVWGVVAVVVIVSIVLSIVFLVRRRRAWWIALIGWVVTIAGSIVSYVLYIAAVGYGT